MKIETNKKDLLDLINYTQGIAEKKTTMPILVNFLLTASNDTLKVFATNLVVSFSNEIKSKVESPGTIAVNSTKFFNLIKELPSPSPIVLEKKQNNWLKVCQDKSVFHIIGENPDRYPDFPSFSTDELLDVQPRVFSEMVDRTIFSVSTDEVRYHLNGVYLEKVGDNGLRMVATDGHRLSIVERDVDSVNTLSRLALEGIIIPFRGLNAIKRFSEMGGMGDGQSSFQIAIEGPHLVIYQGPSTLFIRLVDGKFPRYQQIVPQKVDNTVLFDRENILSSLKRVEILSNQKSKNVILDLSNGVMKVSSNDPNLGDAKEELSIDYSGDKLKASFNIKYILDALNSMKEEKVDMGMIDNSSPFLLRPHGDKTHTCVVMPMHI